MEDGFETPYECNETNDGVDVKAKLREGASCAGENSDEAVYASNLVEEL